MNSETGAALTIMALAALSLVVLILLITAAPADAVCLSKSEARKLWPTAHLHWYSRQRCWSNRHGPPHNLQIDPVVNNSKAQAEPRHKKSPRRKSDEERTYRPEEFNPLDAMADSETYFAGEPIETWASVTHLNLYRQFTPWDERIDGSLK